jgi:hypothetical protein
MERNIMTRIRPLWVLPSLLVIAVCCAIGLSPRVHSQSTAPAAQGVLTDDGLRTMLDGMGYEPKPLSKGFLIAVKRGTWTLNTQLVISPNTERIGMNANLGIVENPDAITAAQWKALLVSNEDIDPSAFYFDATQKKLYLHRVMDNRGMTPAILRTQIENFCTNMMDTSELWKFTK